MEVTLSTRSSEDGAAAKNLVMVLGLGFTVRDWDLGLRVVEAVQMAKS